MALCFLFLLVLGWPICLCCASGRGRGGQRIDAARGVRERDVELGEDVAGRQGHGGQVGDVPRAEQDAAIVGRLAQLAHDVADLIDALAGVVGAAVGVGRPKVAPLEAVDGAQVALLARPEAEAVQVRPRPVAVPDVDPRRRERARGCAPREEPEQLAADRAVEDAFGRQQWQDRRVAAAVFWAAGGVVVAVTIMVAGFGEGEAELGRREDGERPRAGAVRPVLAFGQDPPDQVQILVFFVVGIGNVRLVCCCRRRRRRCFRCVGIFGREVNRVRFRCAV